MGGGGTDGSDLEGSRRGGGGFSGNIGKYCPAIHKILQAHCHDCHRDFNAGV